MVDDGLYTKIPIPDVVLGQHVVPLKTGTVTVRAGVALPSADSLEIRTYGDPGPGLNPQNNIEPIGIASKILVKLESLAASKVDTSTPIIIGCRSFHAGEPQRDYVDYADLTVDIKTYSAESRRDILKTVAETVERETKIAGAGKKPLIKSRAWVPLTNNTPEVVIVFQMMFKAHFYENATEMEPDSSVEEFSILATSENTPYPTGTLVERMSTNGTMRTVEGS